MPAIKQNTPKLSYEHTSHQRQTARPSSPVTRRNLETNKTMQQHNKSAEKLSFSIISYLTCQRTPQQPIRPERKWGYNASAGTGQQKNASNE
jgi:hypothetical protein